MTEKILEAIQHLNLNARETKTHIKNVKKLVEQLLAAIQEESSYELTPSYQEAILNASILHDIGKAAIPKPILYKKGLLSETERMIVETHPITGMYILKKILEKIELVNTTEENEVIANVILYHHERWDGAGYPNGLKGEEIPFESRLITIIDVYDALTSTRSYKEAWTEEDALVYLENEKEKMFDPKLVDHFLAMKKQKVK